MIGKYNKYGDFIRVNVSVNVNVCVCVKIASLSPSMVQSTVYLREIVSYRIETRHSWPNIPKINSNKILIAKWQ